MKRLFLAIVILPWILIACNSKTENSDRVDEITVSEVSKAETPHEASDAKVAEPPSSADEANASKSMASFQTQDEISSLPQQKVPETPVNIDWDKKIIKTGNIKLEVKSYDNYSQKIRSTIKKYGGYIAKEDNFSTSEKAEAVMVVKVPVQFFEPLLNELPAEDAKQLERNINTEEVTGQIIDTKARLETRKATRAKYLEFLKQSNRVEDILKVQAEINDIQEDIESAEGRLSQLTNEARYSTINLTFFEPKSGYSPGAEDSYANRIVKAFANGGSWFAELFVGLISIWPLWLAVAAIYIIVKKVRKPKALAVK